jgi:hypothetical protein
MGARGWYIIVSALSSAWICYLFPLALRQSMTALEAIISIFSILAGVLVAVISIIGDPSMLLTGNWRLGFEHAKDIQKRISNYATLIAIYVVSLIGVLVLIIILDSKTIGYDFLFTVVLWIVSFGLLLSIPLPYSLMAIQKERMTEEIKRRQKNGVDTSD